MPSTPASAPRPAPAGTASPPARSTDPIGLAVAALNKLAQTSALDRLGLRKPSRAGGLRGHPSRASAPLGAVEPAVRPRRHAARHAGTRVPVGASHRALRPHPDRGRADARRRRHASTPPRCVRPAAAEADDAARRPEAVLKASLEIGLPILGVPEELGGISTERSAMAGTLVAEALAHGDMGLAVATLAPGAVSTALSLWGTEEQQATYLPAFTGDDVPAAALALTEPRPLFDPLAPATTAVARRRRLRAQRREVDGAARRRRRAVRGRRRARRRAAAVPRRVRHRRARRSRPSRRWGCGPPRCRGWCSTTSRSVDLAPLGDADDYADCVRLSRLAWCALSLGTAQAVLDYVIPYVNEREAFGEPISHRQSGRVHGRQHRHRAAAACGW